MAQSKKRPQYVVELVNKTNDYLRFRKVTDTSDTLFVFIAAGRITQSPSKQQTEETGKTDCGCAHY